MTKVAEVLNAMISYDAGDARRINHFLKVYGFATVIGEMEGLTDETQNILEIAAITHDIGIKNSEIKYNSCAGNHQQVVGPPEAKDLLENLDIRADWIERVCWLIAHHHTYDNITGDDYQILVEADFLVNAYENEMSKEAIRSVKDKIFKTHAGIELLEKLYFN